MTTRIPAKEACEQGVCTCGHPAGHHDDEPHGCWDCDCESWSQNDWPDDDADAEVETP